MSVDEDRPGSNGDVREWLFVRARLVGSGGALGVALGAFGTLLSATILADGRVASSLIFSLGALALGVALLGWSGSVAAGRSIESMQTHLDTGAGWTERGSRRAMARVGGFGAGVMTGASIVTVLL